MNAVWDWIKSAWNSYYTKVKAGNKQAIIIGIFVLLILFALISSLFTKDAEAYDDQIVGVHFAWALGEDFSIVDRKPKEYRLYYGNKDYEVFAGSFNRMFHIGGGYAGIGDFDDFIVPIGISFFNNDFWGYVSAEVRALGGSGGGGLRLDHFLHLKDQGIQRRLVGALYYRDKKEPAPTSAEAETVEVPEIIAPECRYYGRECPQ